MGFCLFNMNTNLYITRSAPTGFLLEPPTAGRNLICPPSNIFPKPTPTTFLPFIKLASFSLGSSEIKKH